MNNLLKVRRQSGVTNPGGVSAGAPAAGGNTGLRKCRGGGRKQRWDNIHCCSNTIESGTVQRSKEGSHCADELGLLMEEEFSVEHRGNNPIAYTAMKQLHPARMSAPRNGRGFEKIG